MKKRITKTILGIAVFAAVLGAIAPNVKIHPGPPEWMEAAQVHHLSTTP